MPKKTSKKGRVIPFPKDPQSADGAPSPFDPLIEKLEKRLDGIEKDLHEGLGQIESEIGDFKFDQDELAKVLENRLQKSLAAMIESVQKKTDKNELKFVESLVGQLAQALSGDFLKAILKSSSNVERPEVDDFGVDPVFRQTLKPFFDFLYYKYWRVSTTGIENIPNKGRGLIVGNHSGALPYDGAMIGISVLNEHPIREDARFLVEDFVYHMPFLGSYMLRVGGIRACPENAERLLEKEHLLCVFPEGVKGLGKYYSQRYRLQRFGRGGFIRLCIKTGSPLIPVGVVGAEEIHPIIYKSNTLAKLVGSPYIPITPTFPLLGLLGLVPFPTKWSIHFGKPMSFDKYTLKTLDDGITIHKLSEQVRAQIQEILFEQLKKRRSVWTG